MLWFLLYLSENFVAISGAIHGAMIVRDWVPEDD